MQRLLKPWHSFLSPSRGTAPIAQIATRDNVIGLKGVLGIISMLWNKSVTEVLFSEGYWACDAVGLSSGIRGFSAAEENGRERDGGRWEREKSLNVCVLFFSPPVKDEKRHAVNDAFDFSASVFFPCYCLFFIAQQRRWLELHFNHVLLIEGGMKTKRRVKEAWRSIVSLCKMHCIVCLFFLFVTYIHQVDHFSLSLFPTDAYLLFCLLLSLVSPSLSDSPIFEHFYFNFGLCNLKETFSLFAHWVSDPSDFNPPIKCSYF